ncbi:MAG: hypothetical protein RLZZ426_65 [Actinomycetota bacterium]
MSESQCAPAQGVREETVRRFVAYAIRRAETFATDESVAVKAARTN